MFLDQAPVREVLPRLLCHQELQGEFAHPLKKVVEQGSENYNLVDIRQGLVVDGGWVITVRK